PAGERPRVGGGGQRRPALREGDGPAGRSGGGEGGTGRPAAARGPGGDGGRRGRGGVCGAAAGGRHAPVEGPQLGGEPPADGGRLPVPQAHGGDLRGDREALRGEDAQHGGGGREEGAGLAGAGRECGDRRPRLAGEGTHRPRRARATAVTGARPTRRG